MYYVAQPYVRITRSRVHIVSASERELQCFSYGWNWLTKIHPLNIHVLRNRTPFYVREGVYTLSHAHSQLLHVNMQYYNNVQQNKK